MKQSPTPEIVKTVSVSLLGGFSLEVDGASLTDDINRSLKLWSVLAYLTLHRDRAVPQSEFIELFWPDDHSSNPVNALKTLLYRIRAMLEPLFGPEIQPILAQRGAYIWNPAVACTLDTDRFEALCRLGGDTRRTAEERMDSYREAVELYRGDLLPKLSHQMWLVPLTVRYHTAYITAVKDFAGLLDGAALYEEMHRVCARASDLDNLDEGLHTLIVRALLRQGKDAAALEHYEKATELLYRNLGVRPGWIVNTVDCALPPSWPCAGSLPCWRWGWPSSPAASTGRWPEPPAKTIPAAPPSPTSSTRSAGPTGPAAWRWVPLETATPWPSPRRWRAPTM